MNTLYYWEVITNTGIIISEKNSTEKIYKTLPISNVREFYLTNGKNKIGISNAMFSNKLEFFINNKFLDLRLNQIAYKFFQYKTVTTSLMQNTDNISYSIGMESEDNKYHYKYTINISSDAHINLIAEKFDHHQLIDTKNILLQ